MVTRECRIQTSVKQWSKKSYKATGLRAQQVYTCFGNSTFNKSTWWKRVANIMYCLINSTISIFAKPSHSTITETLIVSQLFKECPAFYIVPRCSLATTIGSLNETSPRPVPLVFVLNIVFLCTPRSTARTSDLHFKILYVFLIFPIVYGRPKNWKRRWNRSNAGWD